MAGISYEYKMGVKREVISALNKVLGSTYPDPTLAGNISVVAEYPLKEISYPMVIVRFNPGELKNIGVGHYELGEVDAQGDIGKVLHWVFQGTITLTVNALTPFDRDQVIVGLINLLAFGTEVPAFREFRQEIQDQDFVSMALMSDSIQETGDAVINPAWDANNEVVFTDSLVIPVWGEFYTAPTTGQLMQISHVSLFPYRNDQPIPTGSQAPADTAIPWLPDGSGISLPVGSVPTPTSPGVTPVTTAPSLTNPVITVIAAYTVTFDDQIIFADATTGPFTITLPTAATHVGRTFTIKRINTNTNLVTITAFGSEKIDGGSTYILSNPKESVEVISDGSNWQIL